MIDVDEPDCVTPIDDRIMGSTVVMLSNLMAGRLAVLPKEL